MLKKILNKLFDKKARKIAKESLKDLIVVLAGMFGLAILIVLISFLTSLV